MNFEVILDIYGSSIPDFSVYQQTHVINFYKKRS